MSCPKCADGIDGWVSVFDEDGTERQKRCECREPVIAARRFRSMLRGLPPRYASVELTREPLCSLDEETILKRLRAYDRDMARRIADGRGLWLTGDRGTGKTCAAAWLHKRATAAGYRSSFQPLTELLTRIRATYDDDVKEFAEQNDQTLADELGALDLLILDDFGRAKPTSWSMQQLYTIVNRRYNDARATVITTNHTEHDLAKLYGWATISRLREMTGREIVFQGADLRMLAGAAADE